MERGTPTTFLDRELLDRVLPPSIVASADFSAADLDNALGRSEAVPLSHVSTSRTVWQFECSGAGHVSVSIAGPSLVVVRRRGIPIGVVDVDLLDELPTEQQIRECVATELEWPVARAALVEWLRDGPARTHPFRPRVAPPNRASGLARSDNHPLTTRLLDFRFGDIIEDVDVRIVVDRLFANDPDLAVLWIPAVPGLVSTSIELERARRAGEGFTPFRACADQTHGVPATAYTGWLSRTRKRIGLDEEEPGLLVLRARAVESLHVDGRSSEDAYDVVDQLLSDGWAGCIGAPTIVWSGSVPTRLNGIGHLVADPITRQPTAPRATRTLTPNSPVYIGCDRYDLDSGRYEDRVPSFGSPPVVPGPNGGWSPIVGPVPGIKYREVEVLRFGRVVGTVYVTSEGCAVPRGALDEAIVDQLGYACLSWADQPLDTTQLAEWSEGARAMIVFPDSSTLPRLYDPPAEGTRTSVGHPITLTVAIVVANGDCDVAPCLRAVEEALLACGSGHIVVLDTRSTESPLSVQGADVIALPGASPALARRVAIERFKGPTGRGPANHFVVFIRAHTIVEPSSLLCLQSVAEGPRGESIGAVVGAFRGARTSVGAASLSGPRHLGTRQGVFHTESELDRWFIDHVIGAEDLIAIRCDVFAVDDVRPNGPRGANGRPFDADELELCRAVLAHNRWVVFEPAFAAWRHGGWNIRTQRLEHTSRKAAAIAAIATGTLPGGRGQSIRSTLSEVRSLMSKIVRGTGSGRLMAAGSVTGAIGALGSIALNRSPPAVRRQPVVRERMARDDLRVVGARFSHHSNRSGYDRMFSEDAVFERSAGFRWVTNRSLSVLTDRLVEASGNPIYSSGAFFTECAAALSLLRHRRSHFHLLYADSDAWFLPALAHRLGVEFSASIHVPAARLSELDLDLTTFRGATTVVVMDESERAFVESRVLPARVIVARHGVDVDFFCPAEDATTNESLFICVGAHLRDFGVLLEAWRRFITHDSTHRLELVGLHGATSEWLSMRLPPRVTITLRLDDNALRDTYRRATALVLPLLDATANNSLLEALACGTPVITTDLPATRSYAGESAILVPAGDAVALEAAMSRIVADLACRADRSTRGRTRAEMLSFSRVGRELRSALLSPDDVVPSPTKVG